jgi:hypothetical protein
VFLAAPLVRSQIIRSHGNWAENISGESEGTEGVLLRDVKAVADEPVDNARLANRGVADRDRPEGQSVIVREHLHFRMNRLDSDRFASNDGRGCACYMTSLDAAVWTLRYLRWVVRYLCDWKHRFVWFMDRYTILRPEDAAASGCIFKMASACTLYDANPFKEYV